MAWLISLVLISKKKKESMISQPVSVLPMPIASQNGSGGNGIERKYFTLLPSITDTHMIEDDLKYKLNKCAFDSPSRASVTVPTPSTSPLGFANEYSAGFRTGAAAPAAAAVPLSPSSSVYNSGSESSTSSTTASEVSSRKRESRAAQGVAKVEQRRRHVCKVCSKGFTTSGHLARHNRIHTGEKNHFCPLEGCNQRFSRHDNCIQHYRTHLRKK